jgi:hypothetical protein
MVEILKNILTAPGLTADQNSRGVRLTRAGELKET